MLYIYLATQGSIIMSNRSNWAIGGGVILGIGVGLMLIERSGLLFVGSILAGLGVGLVASAVISNIGH